MIFILESNTSRWKGIKINWIIGHLKSSEIMTFVATETPNNAEATTLDHTQFWLMATTMSTSKLRDIRASFRIFLKTNKHQHLTRHRFPIVA